MYEIQMARDAEAIYAWLSKRDEKLFNRIRSALEHLKTNPFAGKPLKMDLHGQFSYRVGSYRILYKILRDRLVVYVINIGHRREIYR